MDFEAVFKLLINNFEKGKIKFALIGGFALQAAGYSRTTKDIDILVAKENMPKIKAMMLYYGYDLLYESEDFSNYLGKMKELGRVDFLHAHRKYAREMLENAKEESIFNGKLKVRVIRPEDLIGLKVQSYSNNPKRYHRDMADIEEIIRANRNNLDMKMVEEYFKLFKKTGDLKNILKE